MSAGVRRARAEGPSPGRAVDVEQGPAVGAENLERQGGWVGVRSAPAAHPVFSSFWPQPASTILRTSFIKAEILRPWGADCPLGGHCGRWASEFEV